MEISLNPLDQIDPIVILATIVIFLATFTALRRVFVLPYLVVMERRERLFESADRHASEAESLLREAEAASERSLGEARESAEELLREANDEAERYRKTRMDSATTAASIRLEEGRAQIEQAREVELSDLRQEAIDCVGLACGRLLGQRDDDATETAVDRLMSRRVQ